MNQRERDELLKFLEPLLRTRVVDKDVAAESLILQQCARQPDALYLLVQRAMALEAALQAAQAQGADSVTAGGSAHPPVDASARTREEGAQRSGAWGRGLLAQAGTLGAGVGLGVAAGIVTGGLLLDALGDGFTDGI